MNARYHNTTETAPQQHQAYKVLTTQVIKTPTIQVKKPSRTKRGYYSKQYQIIKKGKESQKQCIKTSTKQAYRPKDQHHNNNTKTNHT